MHSARVGALAVGVATLIVLGTSAEDLLPRAVPLAGLTPEQQIAFKWGGVAYAKVYSTAEGLGPVFNEVSCLACHGIAAGSSNRINTRFGWNDNDVFDPLTALGGSLVQSRGIGTVLTVDGSFRFVGESPPPEANVIAVRRTPTLQGLGFVDAVPDATWLAIADEELRADPATAGRVNLVADSMTGSAAVGKFGWKAQVPTLRQFAGDALRNELGITNPDFRNEACPQGDCQALAFNPAPALNDDGAAVGDLTDFMTMLAVPPRGSVTSAVAAGEVIFEQIGCTSCHRPTVETGRSAIAALDRTSFHPYSDFLLHDVGSLGDGIVQGRASDREMRTAPLWGLRSKTLFLHDGSAPTLEEAIRRHDGQGQYSRERFAALGMSWKIALLTFLGSL